MYISGRLRWCIIHDMEVYKGIAIICENGFQLTEVKWVLCVSFSALLTLFSPLVCTVLVGVIAI